MVNQTIIMSLTGIVRSWFVGIERFVLVGVISGLVILPCAAQSLNLNRGKATVLLEPYAVNAVRVSLSLRRDDACVSEA
jgi:hypothetical protein